MKHLLFLNYPWMQKQRLSMAWFNVNFAGRQRIAIGIVRIRAADLEEGRQY